MAVGVIKNMYTSFAGRRIGNYESPFPSHELLLDVSALTTRPCTAFIENDAANKRQRYTSLFVTVKLVPGSFISFGDLRRDIYEAVISSTYAIQLNIVE